jgi:uncharacterized protein
MKFVLFLILMLVLVWMLRGAMRRRAAPPPDAAPREKAVAQAEDMVACAQCGVHLPRSEALPGRGGLFCGEPHRLVFEREQARP